MKYPLKNDPSGITNCHFGFRLPNVLREKIQRVADQDFITASQVVRRAIRKEVSTHLKENDKRPNSSAWLTSTKKNLVKK